MTKRNALIACPHCSSDNLEWSTGDLEVYSDGEAGMRIGCNSCGAEWTVGLVVTSYIDLSCRTDHVRERDD